MTEKVRIPLTERGLLRAYEAAQYLGIGESTLRRKTTEGKIPSIGQGKLRRWSRTDLDRIIQDGGLN